MLSFVILYRIRMTVQVVQIFQGNAGCRQIPTFSPAPNIDRRYHCHQRQHRRPVQLLDSDLRKRSTPIEAVAAATRPECCRGWRTPNPDGDWFGAAQSIRERLQTERPSPTQPTCIRSRWRALKRQRPTTIEQWTCHACAGEGPQMPMAAAEDPWMHLLSFSVYSFFAPALGIRLEDIARAAHRSGTTAADALGMELPSSRPVGGAPNGAGEHGCRTGTTSVFFSMRPETSWHGHARGGHKAARLRSGEIVV